MKKANRAQSCCAHMANSKRLLSNPVAFALSHGDLLRAKDSHPSYRAMAISSVVGEALSLASPTYSADTAPSK